MKVQSGSRVTQKAVYLELADNVDLESGGAMAVFLALAAWQLDRSFSGSRITAIRIQPDCTFQFFDLPERIKQLRQARANITGRTTADSPIRLEAHGVQEGFRRETAKTDTVLAAKLATALHGSLTTDGGQDTPPSSTGVLTTIYPKKGYGFIRGTNGPASIHYVYFRNITDEKLLHIWNSYEMRERADVDLPVRFSDAGQTRKDAKYPEAIDVQLASEVPVGGGM